MKKIKAAFFNNRTDNILDQVYGNGRREQLAELTDLYPVVISSENFDEHTQRMHELDVIFSTWGMPLLSESQLDQLPRLQAVFYAAGATRKFREPLMARNIPICSATAANAYPVAEFALSQILLAGAGYFRSARESVDHFHMTYENSYRARGNYGGRVSILGNGAISRRLQELLAMHTLDVVVVPSRAERRTVSLEEAFATSFVVVNLFPDLENNAGVYNAPLFAGMPDSAVFINVGRGRQVNEADLIDVLKQRPDLTALLDVQWPEPPLDGSELYALPNVQLSAHIAGSKGDEFIRMADYMIAELQRFMNDEPLQHAITLDSL